MFDTTEESRIGHIELASKADLIVIAPATADAIARFSAGMANDLLAAVVLATRAHVLLAPAMNSNMWDNPLTQGNLARLIGTGRFSTVGPDSGELACGWVGAGRMVDPSEILAAAEASLGEAGEAGGPLAGRRIVVTAGPTWEAVDDVRFLGNRSSGKMGFALADAAARMGGEVTLIAGPVSLPSPASIRRRIDVESALEMRDGLRRFTPQADVVVMAAAVADFRPGVRVLGKLSRRQSPPNAEVGEALRLVPNPDLLAELGRSRTGKLPVLVGFAAEVGVSGAALAQRARRKLEEKRCDVVVANEVGKAGLGFGSDTNAVTLVFSDGAVADLPAAPKEVLARGIWERLIPFLTATLETATPALDTRAPSASSERVPPSKTGGRKKGRHG
jgi:phosphopantothenoylcysteine decarboxylase/phosphopantothenate--cysteine ligase